MIAAAIEQTVLSYRDDARWEAAVRLEEQHRKDLQKVAQRWEEVVGVLNREG